MASTSASSIQKSFKYDVFLSFRGEDTRNTFVGHLYKALEQHGIETYIDDEKIKKGKTISDELIRAIEDSRFYIIILSKNYASSSWCLDELVKIMDCQKKMNHQPTAYPVFFDVEPTEVRKQNGAVGAAFTKHENNESAGKWREALKETADLAGWELKNTLNGHEAKLVQKIVEEISLELRCINWGVDENLIGIKTRINGVVSSLELGVDDVRMIGIKGMGGAGKTTLARAIYEHISYQFEGYSFVENVREKSTPSMSGLNLLQKQVLSDVLSDQGISVSGVLEGKSMLKKKMCGKKVLIVLEDVDKIEQLEALAGDRNWFKPGSRIIITTRDAQVLIAHKVNLIRDVHLLDDKEAMRLFSRHAFGREIPVEGYKELSEQVVRYAAGLPLTIKVLGSFLCGKDDLDWKDALERLQTIPLNETMKVLELSYSDLEEDYKEIFLDVACIFKGWLIHNAVIALESCGFRARIGLRVLELKSLITISINGRLEMHDHIEEMGKNIVRRVNPNKPHKHSRLWIKEEIENILANNKGTQATKCLTLNAYGLNFEILLNGLANMKELRVLQLYGPDVNEEEVSKWNFFDEGSLHLPNALRFLYWHGYCFSSLPKTFQAKNLVGLEMWFSNIIQLWKDGEEKPFLNLRFLKIAYSHRLRTLDLSVAPNLETLILESCHNLVGVHFQVIPNLKELRIYECVRLEKLHMPAECQNLVNLNLNNLKLRTLHLEITPNLETLILGYCYNLVEVHFQVTTNLKELRIYDCIRLEKLHMPAECPKLVNLDLGYLKLRTLHLGITPNLETLCLRGCTDMVELCMPTECPKLVEFDLWYLKLRTLHLGITPNLETLKVNNCTDMVELQIPAECPKLVNLDLDNLKLTTLHLGITPNLETLKVNDCTYMVELHLPAECPKLVDLELNNLKLMFLHLGITPKLETLSLKDCRDLVELHMPFHCPQVKTLSIDGSKLRNLHLGSTPNLQTLHLKECYDLVEIKAPFRCLKALRYLDLTKFWSFRSFKVDVDSLLGLYVTVESLDVWPLHSENYSPKSWLTSFYIQHPADGNLEKLISVRNLEISTVTICDFQCLRKLTLEGGIPEVPEFVVQLEGLDELILLSTKIKYLPESICMLKHLKILKLKSCSLLKKLPDDLGQLQSLEKLILTDCVFLRDIPNSICEMERLKSIDLSHCIEVKKLPEEIGRLECLKDLNIKCTGISHLPQSIHGLKGLRIVGDRGLLKSTGSCLFKIRRTSDDEEEMFCYIHE